MDGLKVGGQWPRIDEVSMARTGQGWPGELEEKVRRDQVWWIGGWHGNK